MSDGDVQSGPRPGLAPLAERPDNLTSMVFAAIRDWIVDSAVPPGRSVSEAMLSKQEQIVELAAASLAEHIHQITLTILDVCPGEAERGEGH